MHPANPMSVDDALSRMELVGHDFYLFADADSGAPSVVYRRKGYDYGVIRLGGVGTTGRARRRPASHRMRAARRRRAGRPVGRVESGGT